jgi:hypothetical protein
VPQSPRSGKLSARGSRCSGSHAWSQQGTRAFLQTSKGVGSTPRSQKEAGRRLPAVHSGKTADVLTGGIERAEQGGGPRFKTTLPRGVMKATQQAPLCVSSPANRKAAAGAPGPSDCDSRCSTTPGVVSARL